jgi:hypothetical protein
VKFHLLPATKSYSIKIHQIPVHKPKSSRFAAVVIDGKAFSQDSGLQYELSAKDATT